MPAIRLYIKASPVVIFLLFISGTTYRLVAQSQTVVDPSYWLVVHNEFRLNSKWSSFIELEERRFMFPDRALQRSLPLIGLKYKASESFNGELDYLNFRIYSPQIADTEIDANILEQRFSLAITYKFGNKKNFSLRLKDEYRLFDVEPNDGKLEFKRVINRMRIQLAHKLALNDNLSLQSSAELLLNYAANTDYKIFDQSRVYLGLRYKLNPIHSLDIGYLNWYQESRTTNLFFNRHIVRLAYIITLDLRSKDQI